MLQHFFRSLYSFSIALAALQLKAAVAAGFPRPGLSDDTQHSASPREIPIHRQHLASHPRKRGTSHTVGLGDYFDATYTVLVDIGDNTVPLVLDTGSADLWVLSKQSSAAVDFAYSGDSFLSSGIDAAFFYGDSHTGTTAFGPIGRDDLSIAGYLNQNQFFASVANTNTSVQQTGAAGIFGLGFPLNSVVWNELLGLQFPRSRRGLSTLNELPVRRFPDLSPVYPARPLGLGGRSAASHRALPTVEQVLDSFQTYGPPAARLALEGAFAAPMFCVALQRDVLDIGGNAGALTLGGLPPGIDARALKWANVRTYASSEGGLRAPVYSPGEEYPLTWEIPLDDVYLNGQRLPRSNLSLPNIVLTALIDTGSSLIRGPADVLQLIYTSIGGTMYPCRIPHTLAFSIAGQLFPVDPRDFGAQSADDSPSECAPALAPADPPAGGFHYSWSLGDPFLKGVLAAFYYGNLTVPSKDPARIGLLSTVPLDAGDMLTKTVQEAVAAGRPLASVFEPAPSGYAPGPTNSLGVLQANTTRLSSGKTTRPLLALSWFCLALAVALVHLLWV